MSCGARVSKSFSFLKSFICFTFSKISTAFSLFFTPSFTIFSSIFFPSINASICSISPSSIASSLNTFNSCISFLTVFFNNVIFCFSVNILCLIGLIISLISSLYGLINLTFFLDTRLNVLYNFFSLSLIFFFSLGSFVLFNVINNSSICSWIDIYILIIFNKNIMNVN